VSGEPTGSDKAGRIDDAGRTPPHEQRSVPDVVAPPPKHRRFPLFDGLRAIAMMLVLLVHVALFTGSLSQSAGSHLISRLAIGLTMFFLVSAFLLYRPFIAHRIGGPGAPAVLDYAKRRFLRIFPAYWVVVIVLVILPGVGAIPGHGMFGTFALLHTLPIDNATGCTERCGLIHTWSLVVELTFYAALPLYVVLANRLARGRSPRTWVRNELLLLAGLAAASLIVRFVVFSDGNAWIDGSLLGNFYWLALGLALAVLSVGFEARDRQPWLVEFVTARPLVPWALAIGGYAVFALSVPVVFDTTTQQFYQMLAFGPIAVLLLLPAVFGDSAGGLPRRILGNRLVAWLGMISYSFFLWHLLIAREIADVSGNLLDALIGTVVATTAVAAISYYVIERPLMRLKYRRVREVLRWRRPGATDSTLSAAEISESGRL
jgi:peptidoglycan/LPS O-acetylase OafA/YrhL